MLSLLTKLSELPIGHKKRAKGAKTTQSLIAMLLCLVTPDGCGWRGGISTLDLLRLPDEVLEQVALILGQQEMFRLVDHISEIGHETSTFGRELCRRAGECV